MAYVGELERTMRSLVPPPVSLSSLARVVISPLAGSSRNCSCSELKR